MTKLAIALASASLAGVAIAGPAAPVAPAKGPVAPGPVAVDSGLSYNLLEVGWLHTESDFPGIDSGDGVGLSLSYSPFQNFYLAASGAWESLDTVAGSADIWSATAGVGGYIPLTNNIHFVTEVGAAFFGYDNFVTGSDDEVGVYVTPHFRGRWGQFEAHVGAQWVDADFSNEWAGFGRLYYGLTQNLDLAAGVSLGSDETTVNVGLRLRY